MPTARHATKATGASPTSGPTASLPKDPQPSVDRLDELARRILAGDILLPKFQREFVWERDQILALLDSVARNFPIGSILLWQSRQELRSEHKIADLEIKLSKPEYLSTTCSMGNKDSQLFVVHCFGWGTVRTAVGTLHMTSERKYFSI